ncbi:LEA type 2 family protein [Lentisalinibacter salinarum]|uniref:LEA type 2 family protein n=1 Tax=Lentisalinibacter salinarum TaxID=2992239 RepID=UPI0038679F4F
MTRLSLPAIAIVTLVTLALGLGACTGLRPGFETPTVTVSSFRPLPGDGAVPRFEIGLHIVNPNREALKLQGLAYTVSLEGRELVKGVDNDLPVIEGYGEGDVTLVATPNLLGGIRLVTDLMASPRDKFSYALEAKLDVGRFAPAIRVRDEGEIALQ